MKTLIKAALLFSLFLDIESAKAQLGVGTITPDNSSILDLTSTAKGLLAPRMTLVNRNAIVLPATGLLIFNTTLNNFEVNTGTPASPVWSALGTVTSVSVTTANGVSGVVSTSTSTPAITLTLGAITPSSVAATGTISGSNLSGTNTGNVTLAGENYLSLAGQAITANAVNLSGTNVTGTLAAARFPALTGDITTTAGSIATTIAASAVTNAKMANMVTKTYKGRTSAGTGVPEDVPVATLKTDLGLVKADVGLSNVTNSLQVINNGSFNSISSGLAAAIPAAGTANRYYHSTDEGLFYYDDGTIWNLISPNYTGDVNINTGSLATTISTNAVNFSKFQQIPTNSLIGRSTAATGNAEIISLGSGLSLSGGVLSASGSGTVTSFSSGNLSPLFTTSISTSTSTPALSFALNNAPANTYFGNATGSATTPAFTSAGALSKLDDTNVTLTLGGSPSTSLLSSVSLALGWNGQLPIARGGTGSATQNFVDLTTNQTVAGTKTFTLPVVGATPTLSTHLTTKGYVDGTFIPLTQIGANNGVAALDAGGKVLASELPTGVLSYKGVWNASTNTPVLSNATGSNGWVYKVSVAGTQNLGSGNITLGLGDEVIHNGSIYQVSPSSNNVTSVNGQLGAVVLNTGQITEGTNLYYTDARVISAPLTGYSVGTNTILNSGNSILTAFQNLQGQLNARETGIAAGTTAQYWRGDKTFQTLDKTAVGLGNVDNTSDVNKPISTLQQTAINLKADLASPTFTGVPAAPTAAAATSTTQLATTAFVTTADNLKANLASPAFTGVPTAPTASLGTSTTQLATTAFVIANTTGVNRTTITADVINNTTSLADVTGLSFPVVAGTYYFKFTIPYTSAATTTGSRWSINGPATTQLNYSTIYTLSATTNTSNTSSTYNAGAINGTSTLLGDLANIEGIATFSASGTVIARFASEIAASAITAKFGGTVVWTKIN